MQEGIYQTICTRFVDLKSCAPTNKFGAFHSNELLFKIGVLKGSHLVRPFEIVPSTVWVDVFPCMPIQQYVSANVSVIKKN